jgi:hypothetical protein
MAGGVVASLDRIRTHGFRRWYERQLIECHAWLVSWFLGVIVLVSGIEVAGQGGASRMTGALLLLEIAERLGEQAACPGCQTYGKFKVESSGPAPLPDGGDPVLENHGGGIWLRVQCRKCGDEWMLK